MRIKRTADGQVFEGPDGPVPAGYERADSPVAPARDLSALPKGPGGFPIVPPEMRDQIKDMPGMGSMVAKNVKERWPEMAAQVAMTPLGPLAGPLAGGAVLSGGKMAQGADPSSALASGGLFAGLGAGIGKGIDLGAKALSGTKLPAYAESIGTALADKLKTLNPALKPFEGLKDMLYSQDGWNAVHTAYDKSLKDVMAKGAGKQVMVPEDTAQTLGLTFAPNFMANLNPTIQAALQKAGRMPQQLQTGVAVDAAELAEKMTGQWAKNRGAYQAAARALDSAGLGDPEARGAYKAFMGLRSYFEKTPGAIGPEGVDVMKAQAGLSKGKSVDELLRRQLGEFADILAPGGETLTKGNMAGPLGVAGGALGGMAGGAFIPGLGHISGALPGAYYGARLGGKIPTYTGMPQGQLGGFLQSLGPRAGGVAGSAIGDVLNPPQEST